MTKKNVSIYSRTHYFQSFTLHLIFLTQSPDDVITKGRHENVSKGTNVENFAETTLSTTEQNNKKTSTTKLKCNNLTSSKICVTKTKSLTTSLIAENISPTSSQIITTTTTTTTKTQDSRISLESFTTSTTTSQDSKASLESLTTAHMEKDFKTTTSQLKETAQGSKLLLESFTTEHIEKDFKTTTSQLCITSAKDINTPKTRSVTEDKRKALKRPTTAIRKDVKSKSSKLSEATTTANASQVEETSLEGNNLGSCDIGDVSERDSKENIVAMKTTSLLSTSSTLKTEFVTQNYTAIYANNLESCSMIDVSETENNVPMKTKNLLAKTSPSLKTEVATQNYTSTDAKNLGSYVTSNVLTKEMKANIGVKEALTSTSLKTELATQNNPSTDEQNFGSFVPSSALTTDRPSNIVAKEATNLLVLTSKSLKTEFTDHDDIESTNIQETMKPVKDLENSNLDKLLRTTKSEINFDFDKPATTKETLTNPKPSVNELETSIISTTEFIQSLYKKSVTSSDGVHQQQENQERGKTSFKMKQKLSLRDFFNMLFALTLGLRKPNYFNQMITISTSTM